MKAKPTSKPGQVLMEVNRQDEPLLEAASRNPAAGLFSLKKILVPVDFSEPSGKAIEYAIALAREHDAAITLIYVVPNQFGGGEYGRLDFAALEAQLRESADKHLDRLLADVVCGSVPAGKLVATGAPAPAIIAAAKELEIDLIVIPTHGRTGLSHVLLGSVAEHVVRRAPCPVLVLREKERDFVAS